MLAHELAQILKSSTTGKDGDGGSCYHGETQVLPPVAAER